ncbi:MAG: DUF3857 domain-containing protein [bacterium]|nr:DUF3857 domain-containing protein [bacterium]
MKARLSKKNRNYFIILLFSLFLFVGISSADVNVPEKSPENPELTFLRLKESGKYKEAINFLEQWTMSLSDPLTIETNIFRINEIIAFPELISEALNAFDSILTNKTVLKNNFLRSRILISKNILLMKQGKLGASLETFNSLGFLDFLSIGPFNNRSIDDFNKSFPPEKGFSLKDSFKGKTYRVSWFKTRCDRAGSINLDTVFDSTDDSFFYFFREITVKSDGVYYLLLGKTGFTSIWLDGNPIFADKNRGGFLHDQFFIKLSLSRGTHKILVKMGNSDYGVKLSMRLTDSLGKHVDSISNDPLEKEEKKAAPLSPGKIINYSLFPALDIALKTLKKKLPAETYSRLCFISGYLLYNSRIDKDNNSPILEQFSNIQKDNPFFSAACFYSGKSERIITKKEQFFKKALAANDKNIEALDEIISIKLNNNFLYNAWPLIKQIRKIDRDSIFYLKNLGHLFYVKGWNHEALKLADKIERTAFASAGKVLKADIHFSLKDYDSAAKFYKALFHMDYYNASYLESLLKCYERSGRNKDARNILLYGRTIFPRNMALRLRLASTVELEEGTAASLPFLSSAQVLCPYNKKVLHRLGIAFHKIGKKDPALYYLKLASFYDPDNFSLKRYISIIDNQKNDFLEYLVDADISALSRSADAFANEPLVVLLEESAIKVNSDGSYEKWVRKIYKINSSSEIKNLKNQYVLLDPIRESLENLECIVINNGSRIEASNRFRRSLSDPASRLYYDMEAVVVPVSSLKKGSILDISYTIKNRSGKEYKNYFGEEITLGSNARTLVSNTVLIHPAKRNMYLHTKKINKDLVRQIHKDGKNIYHITVKNMLPFKKENSMPNDSEILPKIYFTSLKDWDEFYSWYRSLLRNKMKLNSEMKDALKKIISPEDSPLTKVQKIYDHVTGAVRYVGFELGVGGIQPRSSDLTYHSGMGDCKDVSLTLVAMLREAGIDARIALIRTRSRGRSDLSVPFIGEFNHAICFVNVAGGFFLDGTVDDAGFKEFPSGNMNVVTFVLDDSGYSFINTASSVYSNNLDQVSSEINILKNGNAVLKRALLKKGTSAASTRYSLRNPAKKIKYLMEHWNKKFPGSKAGNLNVGSLSLENPVSYNYSVEIPSFAQVGSDESKEIIFNSFITSSDYYTDFAMAKNRSFPIDLFGKWEVRVSNRYILPEGYSIFNLPKNEKITHNKFEAHFSFSSLNESGKKIIVASSVVRFKGYLIETKEYPDFREFTRFINRKEIERIVLVKE